MSKINKGMLSSNSVEWETPLDFFLGMNRGYGPFDLDVCATKKNAKCDKYFTKRDNGLEQKWYGKCWMNPPYGKEIKLWMKKAYTEVQLGNATCVVCLVPARTDTAWWHDYAMKGKVMFHRGRLKFGGAKNSAPFPSAVVVFK